MLACLYLSLKVWQRISLSALRTCFHPLFLLTANEVAGRLCFYRCLRFCPRGGKRGCQGGVHGCWGVCMVAGGCVWLWGGGACVVAGGHSLLLGGMHGCWGGGACIGYDQTQSMSGRYASYWSAFLFEIRLFREGFFSRSIQNGRII